MHTVVLLVQTCILSGAKADMRLTCSWFRHASWMLLMNTCILLCSWSCYAPDAFRHPISANKFWHPLSANKRLVIFFLQTYICTSFFPFQRSVSLFVFISRSEFLSVSMSLSVAGHGTWARYRSRGRDRDLNRDRDADRDREQHPDRTGTVKGTPRKFMQIGLISHRNLFSGYDTMQNFVQRSLIPRGNVFSWLSSPQSCTGPRKLFLKVVRTCQSF